MKKTPQPQNDRTSVFGNRKTNAASVESSADWASADSTTLHRLVDIVASRGGAVRFGYTRDGGAYAVGFYYGSESTTEYCRPSEDLKDFLVKWIEFYEELPYSGGKSPAK